MIVTDHGALSAVSEEVVHSSSLGTNITNRTLPVFLITLFKNVLVHFCCYGDQNICLFFYLYNILRLNMDCFGFHTKYRIFFKEMRNKLSLLLSYRIH